MWERNRRWVLSGTDGGKQSAVYQPQLKNRRVRDQLTASRGKSHQRYIKTMTQSCHIQINREQRRENSQQSITRNYHTAVFAIN